jgi:hypothetical protein
MSMITATVMPIDVPGDGHEKHEKAQRKVAFSARI